MDRSDPHILTTFKHKINSSLLTDEMGYKKFLPNKELDAFIPKPTIQKVCHINCDTFSKSIKIICLLGSFGKLDENTSTWLDKSRLEDKDLPVTDKQRLDGFRDLVANGWFGDTERRSFEEDQWLFLSPTFGSTEGINLTKHHPLPITYCHKTEWRGSFGSIYQIKIHPAHLNIDPELQKGDDPMFALKELISDNDKDFKREREGLHKMLSLQHEHLIQVIDSFKRDTAFYFIFPWANGGDLWNLWNKPEWDEQRRENEMILWVLKQIKGIASGVKELHHPPTSQDSSSQASQSTTEGPEYHAHHCDLKPKNILIFFDESKGIFRGTLRIADAGLVKFHQQITTKRQVGTSMAMIATIDYAPPEALEEVQGSKRSRKFDMWSLGCIFLEFITWVLGGSGEIKTFRDGRQSSYPTGFPFYQTVERTISGNKYKVHSQVKHYMRKIGAHHCCPTTWFQDLLEIIKKDLLVINQGDRIDSKTLDDKLQVILEKAEDGSYLSAGFMPGKLPRVSKPKYWVKSLMSSSTNQ
ncbi:kinase-like domain-containing protein [Whalleya microplaca]|nr:kinase-like domain-containing protein [Whalleya microplaca]